MKRVFVTLLLALGLPVILGQTLEQFSTRYCCHLSKKQLELMYGVHRDCPDRLPRTFAPINKCSACPMGTCRLLTTYGNHRCYCPEYFVHFDFLHDDCTHQFQAEWPLSAGKPNVFLRSCARIGAPNQTSAPSTPNTTSTAPSANKPAEKPSDKPSPVENPAVSVADGSKTEPEPEPKPDTNLLLSPEVIGAIVAGIFGLIGVFIAAYFAWHRTKRVNET